MSLLANSTPWLEVIGWGDQHVRELRSLAYSFLRHGKFEKAAAFFEALVVLCPDEAYDSQCLGALYLETGRLEQAHEQLEYALDLDPHHLPTLLNKAKTLLSLGRQEEGLAVALSLEKAADPNISGPASALVLGYLEFAEPFDR